MELLKRVTLPEGIMLSAFGIFSFVYPFAIMLLSFDWMPFGMEWMSSLLLAMLGVTAGAWLLVNFGTLGLVVSATVMIAGLGLEYLGVTTGFPFGVYSYTGVLVPELAGGVPLAIGFAWLLVVVGGIFTAKWAFQTSLVWAVCVAGAVLAVGLDFLLEPVAYHVKGYWRWQEVDGYYGVPWSNFLAWLIAALLMNVLASRVLDLARPAQWSWMPIALYVMNVVMFGIVNITHGFWWSGLVGLILLVSLWLLRLRKMRAPSNHPSPSATTPSS